MSETTAAPPRSGGPAPRGSRGRYPSTALALIGAVIGCLGIVAFLVLVVVRPDQGTPARVDWHATAAEATEAFGPELIDPQLPEGWTANYARLDSADGAPVWEVGLLTPGGHYIGLSQTLRVGGAAIALPDAAGEPTGEVRLAGIDWTVRDQRAADPTGNYAYSLGADLDASFVLLHGTGTDDEFAVVAGAVAESAGR